MRPGLSLPHGKPVSVDAERAAEPLTLRRVLGRAARWAAAALLLLLVVGALGRWLRPELEALGRAFVERFGYLGMGFGAFLADAFHFPVPPQFYMLLAIAGDTPPASALSAIVAGSLSGGLTGFFISRRLSRWPRLARWLERSVASVQRLGARHGYRLVIAVSLTPIAYSLLCYVAGAYGLPKRLVALLTLLRIPKLIFYYYLVRLGWGFG